MPQTCCKLCALIWIVTLTTSVAAFAGDVSTKTTSDKPASSNLAAFREKSADWNKLLAELQLILTKTQAPVSKEELKRLVDAMSPLDAQLAASSPEITKLAEAVLLENPVADPQALDWLDAELTGALSNGRYLEASRIGKVVSEHAEHLPPARRLNSLNAAIMSSFSANQFDLCKVQLEALQKAGPLSIGKKNLLATNKQYIVRWKAEQEIRDRESRSNDLPRVKLQTTKGDIVFELFKNDAPDTVAAFISAIDAQKLNDSPLKKIEEGMVTALQISAEDCPLNSPNRETSRNTHRLHFHGSLSVGRFDSSNGTKIVISLKPEPVWDMRNTVFGRIVEGTPVLEETLHVVQNSDGDEVPKRIIQAMILRK